MSLLTIPPEIWAAVDGYLDDDDRRHLCKCCHALMSMLQAKSYRCVRLDDSSETGRGVLALAFGPRARFVRRIQYSPYNPHPIGGWGDEYDNAHDKEITLSDETRKALESLHRFVGLQKFRLILGSMEWSLNGWPNMPDSLTSSEFNNYHLAHDEEPWRALLEGSLLALTKSAGAFYKLEIANLPPIPTEQPYMALETSGWQNLLQGLTSLDITLAGDPGFESANLTIAHQEFLGHFPRIFLGHIPNVERLRLAGKRDGFIGHHNRDTPIDWAALSMPRLKIFELEYSYLNKSLASFLLHHSSILERIYLKHCIARSKSNWKSLFQGFVEADPTGLLEIRIVAYPAPKRSFYPSREEWYNVRRGISKQLEEAELAARWWVPFNHDDWEDDEAPQIESGPDQLVYDLASPKEIHLQNRGGEEATDHTEEGGSKSLSCNKDQGDFYEDADDDDDASDDSEGYATRNKILYDERLRPWEEVVVDERRRRFVVGKTCRRYGDIFPVESYRSFDPADDADNPEFDESDVVDSWNKVERLLQRNMAKRVDCHARLC